jgi:hypothetical protein
LKIQDFVMVNLGWAEVHLNAWPWDRQACILEDPLCKIRNGGIALFVEESCLMMLTSLVESAVGVAFWSLNNECPSVVSRAQIGDTGIAPVASISQYIAA